MSTYMYLYQCVLQLLFILVLGNFDSPPIRGNVQFIMLLILCCVCTYVRVYVCTHIAAHVQVYTDTHLTHVHICGDYTLVNNCCCN